MENKVIVANLKMNMTYPEVKNYLNIIGNKIKNSNVVICPSSIYISCFLDNGFSVGIQNIYQSDENCTGEVSARQAKSVGVNYCIIGHSERKVSFNEYDNIINQKIIEAVNNKIIPIVCVGETLSEKEMLKTNIVLKRQLKNYLRNVSSDNIFIAYEPIWSIGTKKIPSTMEIEKTISYIKMIAKELYNIKVKVLYGGSIDENNIISLNKVNNIDGYLVGSSSIYAYKFLKLIEVVGLQ